MADKFMKKLSALTSRYLSKTTVFAMDVFLSVFASCLVLVVASIVSYKYVLMSSLGVLWVLLAVLASLVVEFAFRPFCVVIRYSSLRDILKFTVTCLVKVAIMAFGIGIASVFTKKINFTLYQIVLLGLDFLLSVTFLIGARVLMIAVYNYVKSKGRDTANLKKLLIYGTNEKSISIIDRYINSSHYKIIGFIETDRTAKDLKVSDYTIFYAPDKESFEKIVDSESVDAIFFSSETDLSREGYGLVDYAVDKGIKVLFAPSADEYALGAKKSKVREIKIEDLLGREEIKVNLEAIKAQFRDKVVLITGAAGSIGSELCRQVAGFGVRQIIFYDCAETPLHYLRLEFDERFKYVRSKPVIGDVRLERRLDFVFRKYRPQIVFHAAAYKHVPLMEENPCEAILTNVYGSRLVADKCIEYGVEKMVMISTDKAVNPTNVMGCSKRLAEIYVQSLGLAVERGEVQGKTKFITTRFGNVLGSNGSVIPRFHQQIKAGGPVTVTHPDINRFFMTIPEACRLVMEASTIGTGNQIVVFDMGEPVKIVDLARKMIRLSGYKPDEDIQIVFTGLRPGEKLYEEVLCSAEDTDPTSHDRVRVAHVRDYSYEDACKAVDELEALARAVKIPEMVRLMKRIVPEFKSQNSEYERFDEPGGVLKTEIK